MNQQNQRARRAPALVIAGALLLGALPALGFGRLRHAVAPPAGGPPDLRQLQQLMQAAAVAAAARASVNRCGSAAASWAVTAR